MEYFSVRCLRKLSEITFNKWLTKRSLSSCLFWSFTPPTSKSLYIWALLIMGGWSTRISAWYEKEVCKTWTASWSTWRDQIQWCWVTFAWQIVKLQKVSFLFNCNKAETIQIPVFFVFSGIVHHSMFQEISWKSTWCYMKPWHYQHIISLYMYCICMCSWI